MKWKISTLQNGNLLLFAKGNWLKKITHNFDSSPCSNVMLAPLFNQVIDKIDLKQFALPGRSTTHALIYLFHCILEALDNSHCYARILFTDLSKGFDQVYHSVLVSELRGLGVHEALIRWIGAFLTGRSQQVKIVLCPTALFQGAVSLRGQD